MGVMRFTLHPAGQLDATTEIPQAFLCGFDGRVFPSRVEIDGNTLTFRRMNSESGKFHLPYPVAGFGRPIVSTATLRESETPYCLALELARGKICQVRNQLAVWESLGMQIPEDFVVAHRLAHRLFAQATGAKSDLAECSRLADQAIAKAHEAAAKLAKSYVRQRLAVRFKRSPQLPVSFGCQLNQEDIKLDGALSLTDTFNAVGVPVEWHRIEPEEGTYHWENCDAVVDWAHDRKLLMRAGPLLDFSENGLPQWLKQWGHDFYNLQSFISDFVETAVSRYTGKIRVWELATRANVGGAFKLNEEERLSLLARTLEVARQVDGEAQFFLRIDQPWGEYQTRGEHRLSPIQFVDALLRFGTGLAGVNLEIPIGFNGRGNGPRDLLDFSRMIDQWTVLEVPLHVTLCAPTTTAVDAMASDEIDVQPAGAGGVDWTPAAQASWITEYVSLLMAKQSVVAINWSHLYDASPHVFPNGGLVDGRGRAKAGLEAFNRCRSGQVLVSGLE